MVMKHCLKFHKKYKYLVWDVMDNLFLYYKFDFIEVGENKNDEDL